MIARSLAVLPLVRPLALRTGGHLAGFAVTPFSRTTPPRSHALTTAQRLATSLRILRPRRVNDGLPRHGDVRIRQSTSTEQSDCGLRNTKQRGSRNFVRRWNGESGIAAQRCG